MNAESSPDALLAGIQAGESHAFDELVARLQRPLFTFAWRYLQNNADAEDIVVDTFVRLFQARGRLRADTNLTAWLYTTLANLCHNRHRWRKRHREATLDDREEFAAPHHEAPDRAAERDETSVALRGAIDRLPHDQRTVVLLHHYEHLSYRGIGAIVGCSERGVETRLYRARQQLKIELSGHFRETTT